MMQPLLIGYRGEIACRIIRTARRLGIRTVAVYSDADAKALHVRQADEAVHIGPSPARESYLVGDKIIATAKATGAEAIHPGYGFVSENADFAQLVIDAGLVWVGPKPNSILAMGLRDAAKKLMDAAGVPTTPGYLGEDQDPAWLQAEADAIGYPVLIEAAAGGGKGMRGAIASLATLALSLSACGEGQQSAANDAAVPVKASAPMSPARPSADQASACTPAPRLMLADDFADPRQAFALGSALFRRLEANFADAYRGACAQGLVRDRGLAEPGAADHDVLRVKNAPDANVASIYLDGEAGAPAATRHMVLEYAFLPTEGAARVPTAAELREAMFCAVRGASQQEEDSERCLAD